MDECVKEISVNPTSMHRALLTGDISPIPGDGNSPATLPTVAIAFELALRGNWGFDVDYVSCEVSQITATNTLNKFLKRIAKRNAVLSNPAECVAPYHSSLSIGALKGAANSSIDMYIILKLRQKRLQFDRFGNIISTSKANTIYFGDPGLVDRKGNIYYRPPNAVDDCQVAIFKFFGSQAQYDPVLGVPFNIHLDFESVSRINGVRDVSYIPVIIDPDVRDPGGSGPA